jgi:hypothetical protein
LAALLPNLADARPLLRTPTRAIAQTLALRPRLSPLR